jgi:hypothetical protein
VGEELGVIVSDHKELFAFFCDFSELSCDLAPIAQAEKRSNKAGSYESPHHGKSPKIQILTIDEVFGRQEAANSFL